MIFFGRLSSLAVMLHCAAAFLGGWTHIEWLSWRLYSALPMETTTALCLALSGAALLVRFDAPRAWRAARIILAAGVFLIAAASLFAAWAVTPFQPDALPIDGWSINGDAVSRGLAPQAAVALLGISAVALLLGTLPTPSRDALIHGLLIISLMVGAGGMIGHAADLPILYRWPPYPGIDPLTVASLVLLTLSSSIEWHSKRSNDPLRPMQAGDRPRIKLLSLFWTGLFVVGVTGVVVLARTVETMQIATLEHVARMQRRALREELEAADIATDSIAGRPYLVSQLKLVNQGMATDNVINSIRRAIDSIVLSNVDAMAIYSLNGALVARRGAPEKQFDFDLVLDHTHRLLWDGAPVLRRTVPMLSQGRLVATVVVDVKLPNVRALMEDAYGLGPSAETVICGAYDFATAMCVPQRHRPAISRIDRVREGKTIPIGLALDGQHGTTPAIDHRHQPVISTYAPIAAYPLGIVTKIDRSDLLAPIQDDFGRLVAGLTALLIAFVLVTHLRPSRKPIMDADHSREAA